MLKIATWPLIRGSATQRGTDFIEAREGGQPWYVAWAKKIGLAEEDCSISWRKGTKSNKQYTLNFNATDTSLEIDLIEISNKQPIGRLVVSRSHGSYTDVDLHWNGCDWDLGACSIDDVCHLLSEALNQSTIRDLRIRSSDGIVVNIKDYRP